MKDELMKVLTRVFVLFVAVPLVLAACSESSTGPGEAAGNSYLRAELSGSFNGKFDVKGGLFDPVNGAAYGALVRDDSVTMILVQGIELDPDDEEEGRFIQLWFLNPKVGTYGTDKFCYSEDEVDLPSCVMVSFYADETLTILDSGTVRITSMNQERIKGTFEGSGQTWMALEEEEGLSLQMKNGSFDVRILDFEGMFDPNQLPPGLSRMGHRDTRLP
jgi:hypothetical protein